MLQRWQQMVAAAFILGVPLACGREAGPAPTAPVKKSPAKPEDQATKPPDKAAKPAAKAAKPGSLPPPGMIPGDLAGHRPPVPAPSTHHTGYEVPQAKSLAATPDMVLNSRVRASLMSALMAANQQDIDLQTVKGVVTLTGTVKTQALRARAEQVARGVHGVQAVRDQLTVK